MDFLAVFAGVTALDAVGAVFVLIGALFLYPAIREVREDIASQTWPEVAAVLKDVERIKVIREDNEENHYRQYVSHACGLTYVYGVNGQSYEAFRQEDAADEAALDALMAGRQPGEMIPVYYNPRQPERHRFARVSALRNWTWLLPIVGFSGFGVLVLYMSWRFEL